MIRFAKAISFFLHPVVTLLPIPFILVIRFSSDYSYALKWTIFSYAFILTAGLFVAIGVLLGFFSNFNVSDKRQRPLLFSIISFTTFCYLMCLLILHGPEILFLAVFAIIFALAIFAIVNNWIKASLHLATATGVFLLMGIAYGKYFFGLLVLIPLLAWSRVKTKEHTLTDTIVGTALGIAVTLMVYLIGKYFFLEMIYS